MRPLRLDIAGFAAFRDLVTLDFTDADYFALTGPTGSGKSTVIDAMTFALYGSAPRWGRENAIQYALAPTANRCTIRLVFDLAGQRFVVAREVRRSGKQISQKNPRLERYLDPAATGDPDLDEPTESLAADARSVRQQVGELLGLDFEDFCTCVVLPQGDFATFLRATVAERQTILLKLLGARHYETIGRLANRRAADANARIDALQRQLTGYADATEEAEAAARDRQHQLAALATLVTTRVSTVTDLLADRVTTTAILDRLRTELELLTAVEVPDGIDAMHEALLAADQAYADADRAERQTRDALAAAEKKLQAGPQRAPLEESLRWHADRDSASTRLPEVAATAAAAAAALAAAQRTSELADQLLEQARTDHERCRTAHESAAAAVAATERQVSILSAVAAPTGTSDLDNDTEVARATVEQAAKQVESAETTARAAAAAVAALPERSAIAALQRAIEGYAATLAQRVRLDDELQQTMTELAAAEQTMAEAQVERDQALEHLEQLRTRSVAADLRPHLAVGASCPVCDQTVSTLPPPLVAPALDAARASMTRAERRQQGADQAEKDLQQRRTGLSAQSDALAGQLAGLDLALSEALPGSLGGAERDPARDFETAARLSARMDDLQQAQQAALSEREASHRALRSAQLSLDQATERAQESWASLHARHGQLSEFCPPPITAGRLAEAWDTLLDWAGSRIDQLTTGQVEQARLASQSAVTKLQSAAARLDEASGAARTAGQRHTMTAVAESEARTEHANVTTRLAELESLLADRPTAADARRDLAEHQRLDAAARDARTQTQAAARARQQAEEERNRRRAECDTARSVLQRVRESLIPLGVPSVDDTNLSASWSAILNWSRDQATSHRRNLSERRAELAAADRQLTDHLTELADQLRRQDLTITPPTLDRLVDPSEQAKLQRIPTEVELAAVRAAGPTETISRRRGEAAGLRTTIAADTETEQVSRQLARMMSAKQFPQWLADAALDTLVADASALLLALSSGQFELSHQKGEFFVIDHADADSARSVKTLSGGETFQASLALALALSEQLSTLAAGGRTTLDSIFLDEGFGTLDPDALEIVAGTLETLAQGDRMVGVITHVPALADRIPVRFAVSRDSRTSQVVRVGS